METPRTAIPRSWDEVTWRQYARLSRLEDGELVGVVQALTGLPRREALALPLSELELGWLSESPPAAPARSRLEVGGVVYGFDPEVLTLHDYIRVEQANAELKNGNVEDGAVLLLAAVLRPQEFEGEQSDAIVATLLRELPNARWDLVLGLLVFLDGVLNNTMAATLLSSVATLERLASGLFKTPPSVGSSGGRSSAWRWSLARRCAYYLVSCYARVALSSLRTSNIIVRNSIAISLLRWLY